MGRCITFALCAEIAQDTAYAVVTSFVARTAEALLREVIFPSAALTAVRIAEGLMLRHCSPH